MIFSKEAQLAKLRKLRDLFTHERTESAIKMNAEALYNTLIRSWEINQDEVEENVSRYGFETRRAYHRIHLHILFHIGVMNYIPSSSKWWYVECTPTEWRLFKAFADMAIYAYEEEIQKEKKRLAGILVGMLDANFPCPKPVCPECQSKSYKYYPKLKKFACIECGYTRRKNPTEIDGEAYLRGMQMAGKLNPKRLLTKG